MTFSGCHQKEKTVIKAVSVKKEKIVTKEKEKKKEKELDTINKKNAVSFLKAYGKLNPETIGF